MDMDWRRILLRFLERHPARPPAGMAPAEFRSFIDARRAAMADLRSVLAGQAEGLLFPVRNGGYWGVSKDPRPDGMEWRITRFDRDMEPLGHEAHRSAEQAIEDAVLWTDLARLRREILFSGEAFRRWFRDSKVVDSLGRPRVMYHGTSRDFDVFDRLKSTEWRRPSMDTAGIWFSSCPTKAARYSAGEGHNLVPVYLSIQNPKLYRSFDDFLREMHEAEGRRLEDQNPRGAGSTEGLRAKLEADGFDGIQFEQTDNESLYRQIEETQDAIRRARQEEFSVKKAEREPYVMKRERLERTLHAMQEELRRMGGSTEFDGHDVFVALHPQQVKSAIGNSGRFNPDSPSLVDHDDVTEVELERMRAYG